MIQFIHYRNLLYIYVTYVYNPGSKNFQLSVGMDIYSNTLCTVMCNNDSIGNGLLRIYHSMTTIQNI